MKTKDFNKQALTILKQYFETNKGKMYDYEINTLFGALAITFSPSPRIKAYSIFMRFLDTENFNHELFKKWLGSDYNRFSLKWNIHLNDAELCLNELDERLSNLKWLENKLND